MAASGTESPPKPSSWRAKAEAAAGPPAPSASSWGKDVLAAAHGMAEAYGEHLNHHCARCTNAWKKLRDALDAAPPTA